MDLPQPVPCARHTLLIEHASLVSASAGSLAAHAGLSTQTQPLSCWVTRYVAQFVRAWQAISQVVSSSPALSLSFFLGTRPICRASFISSALLAARGGAGDKTCLDVLVTIADAKLRP